MRVRLSIDNLRRLFKKTLEKTGTRKNVALRFGVSIRALSKSIYLRKQREIVEYFMKIGTNNPKHYQRFKKFTGGVPKWS